MKGWRTRIGFLVPPGNPTVEPEMAQLTPPGVSLHFTRMNAEGPAGTHTGQEERNRSQVESIPACVRLLAMVSPSVIVMAHTATSYTLGQAREAELVAEMETIGNARFITAFGSVLAALQHLGIRRIAYATPYSAEMTARGRLHLESCGINVVNAGTPRQRPQHLRGEQRTRLCDRPAGRSPRGGSHFPLRRRDADPRCASAAGRRYRQAVISAASAMMWHALRTAGVRHKFTGFGQLLRDGFS